MAPDKKSVDPRKFPNDEFELFSIPAYDEGKPERTLGSEIGSSKQILQPNDVLISRIVPHIRRAWVVPESNGLVQIGSSEWIIFRANDFYPEYLRHYLLSDQFNAQFMSTVAGVGGSLLRARPAAVAKLEITLPEINEQKRIATILDKADEIKHNIHKMKDIKKQTEVSIFLDMFGDPVANSKGWNVQKLGQITDGIRSGSTPKGGSKNYVENGIAFFRSQNVWRNKIEFSDVAYIDEKMHSSMKKTSLKKNDILITKTGRINTQNSSLGRAALFTGEDDTANINGHVYFIRLNDSSFLHEFVVYLLTTDIFREYIRSVCVGGIDKRQLNKDHIENFPIISPPLNLQKKFTSKIKQLSSLTKNSRINLSTTLTDSVTKEMLT